MHSAACLPLDAILPDRQVQRQLQYTACYCTCPGALQQYKGKNMRVEVVDTSNTVIGAAICQVSGADTAFEINHPGG